MEQRTLGVISGPTRKLYFKELQEVVTHCIRHEETRAFKVFCRHWLRKGAPIDPAVLYLPKPSAQIILRQIASCLPGVPEDVKANATIWLLEPECRYLGQTVPKAKVAPRKYELAYLPYNLCLYAPKGSVYHEFNIRGFQLTYVDEKDYRRPETIA